MISNIESPARRNIPHNLLRRLPGHDVTTVAHKGWGGLKNGELLKVLERAGFEVFVTGDQGIEYQNRIVGRRFGIVTLSTNNWPIPENWEGVGEEYLPDRQQPRLNPSF